MNSRQRRISLLMMIWTLATLSTPTPAQEVAENSGVSSASLSNWRTAVHVFLSSQNKRLVERAERLLDDAIAGLPAAEQKAACEYLDDHIRRGFTRNSRGMRCLFSASERDKRTTLFNKLKSVPWAQWNGASLEGLLQAYAESPGRYSSDALLHEDLIAFCRRHSQHASPDLVERILKGYGQREFFNVLRFAHGVHADQANRWRAAFEAEYGDHASAATLWQGFQYLNQDLWDSLSRVRDTYQQHLGNRLFARRPLSDWLVLESEQTLQLARASSHNLLEWQFKLAQALKSRRHARGLSLLYYLCHTGNNMRASYSKLAPLFATQDQAFFAYLHQPARESQSVLDLLHTERSNWDQSLDSLCAYLSVDRESSWTQALFPLLKRYYPRAAQRIDETVITPI